MGRLAAIKEFANSLTGRMVLGVLLIHALLAPLLFGGLLYIVKSGYQTQFINQVRSESHLFAYLVERDFNSVDLRARIEDILLGSMVIFLQIIRPDGTLIYDLSDTSQVRNFEEDFFFGQHDDTTYYIAIPIHKNDGDLLATIRLGYDETPTTEQIKATRQRSIYLAIIYITLTLALVAFSGFQVTQSLRRLRDAARKVVMDDNTRQLDIPTSVTEVTSLGRDLERMRWKLVHQGEMLEHQALHDSLTSLPNRNLLYERMQQALAVSQRMHKNVALFIMDLDHFKEVNDTLGHHVGDLLLQKTALRLRSALRESDTVARLGGDEFAILLPTIEDAQHAVLAAQKILKLVYRPIVLEGHTLTVGGSIGIALSPDHGQDNDTLMRHADTAMYYAKRTQSGYSVYDHDLEQQSITEPDMASKLRLAMERNELLLHYQPKVDMHTGKVSSVEALVRWQHPQQGLLMPAEFIGLAEKSGVINPLTLWVVKEALRQCLIWRQSGVDVPIAMNLSARNLQSRDMPDQIGALIKGTDINPAWLEFEISESAILSNPGNTLDVLRRLHLLGVKISIDNYGTAPASLYYLNQLPMHQIKIDKSFIADMHDAGNARIVRAAIDLAHNLGRTAIAKGVESQEAFELLKSLGCDMVQGYYMAPPLTASDLLAWLKNPTWAGNTKTSR
ncbi:MAG TPA: EAL domain-containing protein [Gammaproteobacteria bacterium]|nr:EAL domain-containing protein [Gammaproteobacteria bacterium]